MVFDVYWQSIICIQRSAKFYMQNIIAEKSYGLIKRLTCWKRANHMECLLLTFWLPAKETNSYLMARFWIG